MAEEKKLLTRSTVFVHSIKETKSLGIVIEASNGSHEGPPFVKFNLDPAKRDSCHIGKAYTITIEEK